MDPRERLRAAATRALSGEPESQAWMDQASCLEDWGPQLSTLWESAWSLITDLTVDENVRYLVVLMLKKAVQIRWAAGIWPPTTLTYLQGGTCRALITLATRLGPHLQPFSPVLRQLVSVVVLMALCVDNDDGRPCRELAQQALTLGLARDEATLYLSLQILESLAEEAIVGQRISKKAAKELVDLVDDVVNLSGSTWEDMCAGMGQMDVEVLAAFMAASADCMAKWARINGVTWNQVFRLSILVEVTLTSAPLMHHHSAVAVARINTQVPRLLLAVIEMIEAIFLYPPDLTPPKPRTLEEQAVVLLLPEHAEVSPEEARSRSIATIASALVSHAGPETDMSRQCLLRGISALVKSQKQWAMRCEAQQNGLLELLLQGMEDQDLTTSTVCIETWMELHKVPFPQRAPSLQLHLYQHLLPRLIKRACRPVDLDELGEESWEHYREHTLGPLVHACYLVLRAEYARSVLLYLEPLLRQRTATLTPQELEATFWALRLAATDLSQRASLLHSTEDITNALAAGARAQSQVTGVNVTAAQVRADAEASNRVLHDTINTVLHLKAEVPAFTASAYAVREVITTIGLLNTWIAVNDNAPLSQHLSLFLLRALPIAAARSTAATHFNLLACRQASRQPCPLTDPFVFEALARDFNHYLEAGFTTTRLLPEDACTVMQALCKIVRAFPAPELRRTAVTILGDPVLKRLRMQISTLARSPRPVTEAVAAIVQTDLMVVATIMSEMATDASGPAVFEENWRLVSEVASTSLARHEGIADALFEVLGRSLCMALAIFQQPQTALPRTTATRLPSGVTILTAATLAAEDTEPLALSIVEAIASVAQVLSMSCASGLVLFVQQFADVWGPSLEENYRLPASDRKPMLDAVHALFRGLVDLSADLISKASTSAQSVVVTISSSSAVATTAAMDLQRNAFDACSAMVARCPAVLVDLPLFPLTVGLAVYWLEAYITQPLTTHALSFLRAVLGMSDAAEAEQVPTAASLAWRERLHSGRREALQPHMSVLIAALLRGVLGSAVESLLPTIASLLRALARRDSDRRGCLATIKHYLFIGPSNNVPEVIRLRVPFTAFLERAELPSEQEYADQVRHVWGFCQGKNRLDVLMGPPPEGA